MWQERAFNYRSNHLNFRRFIACRRYTDTATMTHLFGHGCQKKKTKNISTKLVLSPHKITLIGYSCFIMLISTIVDLFPWKQTQKWDPDLWYWQKNSWFICGWLLYWWWQNQQILLGPLKCPLVPVSGII